MKKKIKETKQKIGAEIQKREEIKGFLSGTESFPLISVMLKFKREMNSGKVQLGHKYRKGQGVKQNHKEAFRLYQLAALEGDSDGEVWLAFSYLRPDGGLITNDKEAFRLSKLGVEKKKSTCLQQSWILLLLWKRCRKGCEGRY